MVQKREPLYFKYWFHNQRQTTLTQITLLTQRSVVYY